MSEISVRIKTWVDTAASWAAKNPLLYLGERGYETDTFLSKTGNGIDHWNELPYDEAVTSIVWRSGQTYAQDAVVGYLGKVYISQQNNNLDNIPADTPDWWLEVLGGAAPTYNIDGGVPSSVFAPDAFIDGGGV